MGTFTTNYGQIAPRVGIQAVARLLAVGLPLLITQRFAQTDDAQSRSGNTIKWHRYHAFAISTAPLAAEEQMPEMRASLVEHWLRFNAVIGFARSDS